MNIFFLDPHPNVAASYLCDKHVVKMGIESAQMLSTAHWSNGGSAPYKRTHTNHPSTIWARASTNNYDWLVKHAFSILDEYEKRYGRRHKTRSVVEWLDLHRPDLPVAAFTLPPQCMPDAYKREDTVDAYRAFYAVEKIAGLGLSYAKAQSRPEWLGYYIG